MGTEERHVMNRRGQGSDEGKTRALRKAHLERAAVPNNFTSGQRKFRCDQKKTVDSMGVHDAM